MKRIFSFLLAAALFVTACDKKNGGTDTPPAPVNSDFTIEQTALTQGSLDVKITPKDNEGTYYFSVISKKEWQTNYQSDTEVLTAAYKTWFENLAASAGVSTEELLKDALLKGMQTYQFRQLVPETEYVFFVYGVDYTGTATTPVTVQEFATPKVTLNPNATFTITPTEIGSTYFKVNISCSDPSVFYYYDVILPDVYETYCDSKPENIPTYVANYLAALKTENNTYSKMSMAEFISAITVEGEAEYDTALSEAANSLVPEMEYPVFAIGIANDGTFTTNATVQMVKTAETLPNDWILTDEKTTDIQYNATIAPKWDEAYAVILERKMYFEGASDEEMVNDLLAARGGSFLDDLCITRAKVEFKNLIPDEDYYLFLIACTPDGAPKTGKKLNVKKVDVKTETAKPTGAVYTLNVYNVSKTTAKISVSVNTEGEGQTFLTNYITKADLESRTAASSESDALKKHMDEFIDSSLETWNSGHPNAKMDRKEFLSRLLPGESQTGASSAAEISGLTEGTDYYAYVIGIKADGTYTTEPFKKEFTTIADKKSKITLKPGLSSWRFESVFPGINNYQFDILATPVKDSEKLYGKYFEDTDEWAGKTSAEILELLLKESPYAGDRWMSPNRVAYGKMMYVYCIGYDVDGIPTDIVKLTHQSKNTEGTEGTGIAKEVPIDKTETIAVAR